MFIAETNSHISGLSMKIKIFLEHENIYRNVQRDASLCYFRLKQGRNGEMLKEIRYLIDRETVWTNKLLLVTENIITKIGRFGTRSGNACTLYACKRSIVKLRIP